MANVVLIIVLCLDLFVSFLKCQNPSPKVATFYNVPTKWACPGVDVAFRWSFITNVDFESIEWSFKNKPIATSVKHGLLSVTDPEYKSRLRWAVDSHAGIVLRYVITDDTGDYIVKITFPDDAKPKMLKGNTKLTVLDVSHKCPNFFAFGGPNAAKTHLQINDHTHKPIDEGEEVKNNTLLDITFDSPDSIPQEYENLFIEIVIKTQPDDLAYSTYKTCFHASHCQADSILKSLEHYIQSFGFYFEQKYAPLYICAIMTYMFVKVDEVEQISYIDDSAPYQICKGFQLLNWRWDDIICAPKC